MTCLAEPVQNIILDRLYQIFNGVILFLENLFRGGNFDGAFKEKYPWRSPWLKTLTTARADPDTKIAPTRLDRGIEQVKALINRIIELTRDIFKGPSI